MQLEVDEMSDEERAWRAEMAQLGEELADDTDDDPPSDEPDADSDQAEPAKPAKSNAQAPQAQTDDDDGEEADPDDEGEEDDQSDAPQGDPASQAPPSPDDSRPQPGQEPRPFRFRVHGQEIDVPGAIEHDGFIAMPVEQFNRIILPRAATSENQSREIVRLKREVQTLSETRTVKEAQATAALELMDELLAAKTTDDIYEWAVAYKQRYPELKTKAEAEYWKQQAERGKQQTAQEDEARREQDMQETLRAHIANALAQPEFEGLGLDVNTVHSRFWGRLRRALYTEADRDYPERNIRKGDLVIDPQVFFGELEDMRQQAVAARQRASVAAQARDRNDKALRRSNAAPPAVPVAGSPSPRGKAEAEPKNLDEWRESLLR